MVKKTLGILTSLTALTWGSVSMAAEGAPAVISYYGMLLHAFHLDHHQIEEWKPVVGSVLTLLITLLVGFLYKSSVSKAARDVAPTGRFNLRGLVETILEFIYDLSHNVIAPDRAKGFLPVMFAAFLFIFVSNLTGLVPGLTPATESISTNLVLGLFIFCVFNIAGIKEHGLLGYLKMFAGPLLVMAPFIFGIEIIGMLVRPVSLALRLYGNIFGDHLVLSVFTGLTKLVLPSMLLFFGLLVACLQSFVFTLLSGIYISMAISHDH